MAYSIGNFTFETEEEFNKANEELQFINELKKQYNINDKDDAQKILDYLEANNKTFETSIGSWFIKMLDKKGGVNMGTRKPKAATETQGERPATTQKAEAAGTGKAAKTSKPMSTKTKAVTGESDADNAIVSRLEKRINILLVLVIILLIITIVQEIQLIIGNSTSSGDKVTVNVSDVTDKNVSVNNEEVKDIESMASYLGMSLEEITATLGNMKEEATNSYYHEGYYFRGFSGTIYFLLDKDNRIKHVTWETKRVVKEQPDRTEKLNTLTNELTSVFDKIYVTTSGSSWRAPYGTISITNSGMNYYFEVTQ